MKKTLEQRVISEILDKGLAESTWREQYPEAYTDLLTYREDLEESVGRVSVVVSLRTR